MISPTTPGGRASRSASVGARGPGLVVLMAHREGSTGGAVLAGSPIAAPHLQVDFESRRSRPSRPRGHARRQARRAISPAPSPGAGIAPGTSPARRTPHRRRAASTGTSRSATTRNPTTGLSSALERSGVRSPLAPRKRPEGSPNQPVRALAVFRIRRPGLAFPGFGGKSRSTRGPPSPRSPMVPETELPFRELVDAAPDGVIVCNHEGLIILVNAEVERMFGYKRDELIGERIDVLVPDRARSQHGHHLASYTAAPRLRPMGIGMELTGRRRDGSEIPVEISLSPIQTSRGLMVTAGIRDVTERRKLERENRRANAYLVSAVDSVRDAFALFDEHDRVIMVNSSARQLLGSAVGGAIIGLPFEDLLDKALRAGVFDFSNETRDALYLRWLAYHRAPSGTLEVRTGTGRYLRVVDSKTAEHGTVSTIADVTDDVQRAEELRLSRELAEAASAAKSEFLSSMSHELRTPLNAILGFAQLLERDRKQPLSDRQKERLQHVLRGGEHLLRLIDDVLDLSRIEAGRIMISPEPVDIRLVVDEVITTLEPMASRAGISITGPGPAELPRVHADRTRLAQILMNFGSNAIKYGKQRGHVRFELAMPSPATVRATVIDDGIGIPADKRDKVFEPFQRAGQETGPIEGTGIGLTITKRLAELMKGRVGFSSEVDRGSAFWLEIPVHRRAAAEPLAAPAAAAVSPLATGTARHKVVYVEDNPSNIAFMRDLVDDLPSVELLTAPTAEIGLELIRSHRPQVVIMDINLPGMSGFDAVNRLREWPETRDIPVIGLSAAALLKDTQRAKDAGFYRYLTKPVKVAELTKVLEELLVHP
ncbi:MAG TPA: PAS domain S-box protein [Kofleriaceae bacterium]|nr:PAS domain S-box protein [Kofleriaceae bacterium]